MYLRELLRLRRSPTGGVPIEVLRSLALPMPDEVFEQFIVANGTRDEFQRQYGSLDLHAIGWKQVALTTSDLCSCSVSPLFAEHVDSVSDRTRAVYRRGWGDIGLSPSIANEWRERGTWNQSPVLVRGELVGSSRAYHLVEGHTRIGTLRGLMHGGMLRMASTHQVWLGEATQAQSSNDEWRVVLQTEFMPFLDWIMEHVGDDGDIGIVASRLTDIRYSTINRIRFNNSNLDDVLLFAKTDAKLRPLISAIELAHAEWERFLGRSLLSQDA